MIGNKIGIGIIGLSKGPYFVHEFESDKPIIVAVHGTGSKKIERFKKQSTDIAAPASIDEFWDIEELDAVIVCSSDKAHAQNTIKVLEKNKHIYLEKQMEQTIKDCDDMIDAWQVTDTVFMIGLELRYCTLMKDVKKMIDEEK